MLACSSSTPRLVALELPLMTLLLAKAFVPPGIASCKRSLTICTSPENEFADEPPICTKPGSLRKEEPANGFAQDLNTLLASLTAPTDVTLLLSSDVPGVLGIGGWNPPPGGAVL